jgi:predicted dehydrogenase
LYLNGTEVKLEKDSLGNVGRQYEAFAKGDTATILDFDHAVKRHQIIDAILKSAESGQRVDL